MNKISIGTIIGVIVIAAIILVVRGTSGPTQPTSKEPIRIGAVLSLTGFAAPWGEYAKNGINLAVKNINANGGIDGRLVAVTIEDDHTDGKEAVSAYNKLQSIDKVQGVIGGVFDFTAQPLIPLAVSNKQVFISPSNFRIEGGLELNEQSFVMRTDFSTTLRALQEYMAAHPMKKLAVVHFKSAFGNEIAKTFQAVNKELGRGDIVDESYNEIGANDFRTTIVKLKSQGVDGVFLDMVGNDPINFLTRAKELGFAPTIMTYNGTLDSFANDKDKVLLENVVILNWEVTSPVFVDMYQKEYGIPPTKSADKYFDAVYVMAEAIAKNQDQSKVALYIQANSFVTPNSTVTFTQNHTVPSNLVEVSVFKDGKMTKWVK